MDSHHYHALKKEDYKLIANTLLECFSLDPLYKRLVPDEEKRTKILKDVFLCDAAEMLCYCNVFADSKDVKGLLILTDNAEKHSAIKQFWAEKVFALKTELGLIKNDLSLKTLFRFFHAHKYLVSKWTAKVHAPKQIHIIYLAVKNEYHGKGIAHKLLQPVLDHADNFGITVTLETHNASNIPIYEHFGFELYDTLDGFMDLKQYCFVRKPILKKVEEPNLATMQCSAAPQI